MTAEYADSSLTFPLQPGMLLSMRVSRNKVKIAGSLRGLKSSQFYQIDRFSKRNPVLLAKPHLPEALWTKLDRGRPMSLQQAKECFAAVNRGIFETTKDFPVCTPIVRFARKRLPGGKHTYYVKGIEIVYWPEIKTDLGSVYVVSTHKIQGLPIGFSRHAIDRFMERVPDINEMVRSDTALIYFEFQAAVKAGITETGDRGLMLSMRPLGFFPITLIEGKCWAATSFLTPEMSGTPDRNKENYAAQLEKLKSKFSFAT